MSVRPTLRSPGVSTTRPPPGSSTSSRCAVVCRPLPSARSARVNMTASPTRALVRVDLPAPDGPSRARVRPATTCARTSSRPSPVVLLIATTSTPGAAAATSARSSAASGTRSALVSTTIGVAPLSQASARNRSIRPRSGSGCSGSTTTARSTLAARTWPCEVPGVTDARTNAVRRGRTASAVTRPSGQVRAATQSPTHGVATGSAAPADRSAPEKVRRRGPSPDSASQAPRSTRLTRAGWCSAAYGVKSAA